MRAKTGLVNWFKGIATSKKARVRLAMLTLLTLAGLTLVLTAGAKRGSPPAQTSVQARFAASGANRSAQNAASAPRPELLLQKFDRLIEKASARGSARVIVGLRSGFKPEGELAGALKQGQREEIRREQDSLLKRLEPYSPRAVRQFKSIPYVAMSVNVEALQAMRSSDEIESIREDRLNRPSLVDSTKAVDAPAAWQAGFSGQGQVIAILDTGVEKSHPFLSGKVIAEACFSTNYSPENATSLCPAGVEESVAPDSALPCTFGKAKGCDHGTHVAGIAAGRSPSGDLQGVAKDANLIAVQVFSRIDDDEDCADDNGAPCIKTYDSDYMLGLEHVYGLRQGGMNVAAANLSLGSEEFAHNCDDEFRDIKRLIDNLQTSGVATVVASGNGDDNNVGVTNAITVPACISSAISVGSVGDGGPDDKGHLTSPDVISKFSNRASFLTLLAPGEFITSSSLNGSFETYEGTSMAAPHVAGAWAVLKQQAPNASVAQVLAALRNTGKPVNIGSGLAVPRIQINAARQALFNCSYSVSPAGRSVAETGDIGSFGVAAPAGCPWTASSGADWISTVGGGSGSGTVFFTVAPNSGAARTANIYAGGQTFVVEQAAGVGDSTRRFKLTAPTGLPKDLFGRSVAISGETAVAGEPGDNVGANINQGSVYVFVHSPNGAWSQQARLTAFDGAAGDEFGWSVAIEGDTLVVGARSHAVGSRLHQGAAYVYVRSGATWTLQAQLVSAPDTSFGIVDDNFGESVAISGSRIVVGTPGFETFDALSGLFHRGAINIFNRSGTTWTRRDPPIWGGFNQAMGSNVATIDFNLQGSVVSAILVGNANGSPGSIAGSPPSIYGAVTFYLHSTSSIEWPISQSVFAQDFANGDKFGWSVAFGGDGTAVVGSPGDDTGQTLDHGSAYVLVPVAGAGGVKWTQQAKLTASDARGSAEFGRSVNISGNTVIAGAPSDEVGGNQKQGSAYVFERVGSAWTQKSKLVAEDGEAEDEFGTSVGFSQGNALVGAASANVLQGSAYVFGPQFLNAASTVQFSSATYSVNESAGKVLLTVNRTGNTAAAATVNYATADGAVSNFADQRTDYTQTRGTLHFAPGETSKTVTVFITNDVLPESPETFTVSLSNAVGAAIGTPNSSAVVINSDDVSVGPNPVDPNSFNSEFFVRQHYVDFLNREPDAAGLAFWTNEIEKCGANAPCREVRRINVSAAFFQSIEFQETGYLVYRTYKAAYGDTTSPNVSGTVPVIRLEEFLPDTQQIGAGVQVGIGDWQTQLEANKAAYFQDFVVRPRFTSKAPATLTPTQFVDALFQNAGVTPTATQRQAAINEFGGAANTADTTARARALRRVAENPSLQQRELNRAFVLMQYYGYMRRNPDDPQDTDFRGWKFWLDKLNQFNGNFVAAEMVKAFITSTEYKNRFGQ